MNPRSFAFPHVEGSASFLVTTDHAGSQRRLRDRVMLQLLSVLLSGGLRFLQRSSTRHPHSTPCGVPASMRRDAGFTMFHSRSDG